MLLVYCQYSRSVVSLQLVFNVHGHVAFILGIHLINIKKTWEKLLLAARAIVAIENPAEVCAISSRPYGQRAVLKFASFTGATPIAGRFTPGTFTNQVCQTRLATLGESLWWLCFLCCSSEGGFKLHC